MHSGGALLNTENDFAIFPSMVQENGRKIHLLAN